MRTSPFGHESGFKTSCIRAAIDYDHPAVKNKQFSGVFWNLPDVSNYGYAKSSHCFWAGCWQVSKIEYAPAERTKTTGAPAELIGRGPGIGANSQIHNVHQQSLLRPHILASPGGCHIGIVEEVDHAVIVDVAINRLTTGSETPDVAFDHVVRRVIAFINAPVVRSPQRQKSSIVDAGVTGRDAHLVAG